VANKNNHIMYKRTYQLVGDNTWGHERTAIRSNSCDAQAVPADLSKAMYLLYTKNGRASTATTPPKTIAITTNNNIKTGPPTHLVPHGGANLHSRRV